MQITIDTTKPLSPEDRELLAQYLGLASSRSLPETAGIVTEPAVKPAPAKAPASKPAAKPEPEVVEEPEEAEEDLLGDDEPEVTREQVVEAATAIVKGGGQDKVRAALKTVKAAKVSAVPDEKLAEFLKALNA